METSRRRQPVPRGAVDKGPVALSAGGLQQAVPSHRLGERHGLLARAGERLREEPLDDVRAPATPPPPPSSLRPDPSARIFAWMRRSSPSSASGEVRPSADWCAADGAARCAAGGGSSGGGSPRKARSSSHQSCGLRDDLPQPELERRLARLRKFRREAPSHRRALAGQQRQRRLPAREPPLERPEARVAGERVVQPIKVLEAACDHAGGLLRAAVDAHDELDVHPTARPPSAAALGREIGAVVGDHVAWHLDVRDERCVVVAAAAAAAAEPWRRRRAPGLALRRVAGGAGGGGGGGRGARAREARRASVARRRWRRLRHEQRRRRRGGGRRRRQRRR